MKIMGYDWDDIQRAQSKTGRLSKPINLVDGDYGADPVGDGTFRMVPSGDIVSLEDRNSRLRKS